MSQTRFLAVTLALLLVSMLAFMLAEYAGLPNAVSTGLTVLQVLCVAVMLGLGVLKATTTKLDRPHSEDDNG